MQLVHAYAYASHVHAYVFDNGLRVRRTILAATQRGSGGARVRFGVRIQLIIRAQKLIILGESRTLAFGIHLVGCASSRRGCSSSHRSYYARASGYMYAVMFAPHFAECIFSRERRRLVVAYGISNYRQHNRHTEDI